MLLAGYGVCVMAQQVRYFIQLHQVHGVITSSN